MKAFIQKNYVFVISLLTAILMVAQQAISNTSMDWLAMGYAAGIAILGVIANQWKGKGLTILGMIGTAAYAIVDIANGGHFTVKQLVLSVVIALITAVVKSLQPPTPDAK